MLASPAPTASTSDLSFFSASKVSKPVASASTVVVTTRLRRLSSQHRSSSTTPSSLPPSSPPSTTTSSPLSSPPLVSSPPRKRKSLGAAPENETALPRAVKRLRTASATTDKPRRRRKALFSGALPRVPGRSRTQAPSPEPIYRSSRSRSTSLFPARESDTPVVKRSWATDEDGDPGHKHISSEKVVQRLMKSYKAYFKNPANPDDRSWQPHPIHYPVVELEYPNSNAVEKFILLAPKDKDHYNPIMDLEKSLFTLVEYYLSPDQQALFGPIPSETLSEAVSPPPSRSPSPPHSTASNSSTSSLSSVASALSSLTSISSVSVAPISPPPVPLLRAVQRAIHLQDGPLFLRAMEQVNQIIRRIKHPEPPADPFDPPRPNPMMQAVHTWRETGIPKKVLMRIIEENYQRCVGPNVPSLKRYEAFSSTVYGELMPSLTHEIIKITKLKEGSLFLDLGSGVGNVVVQASLQTGCKSFGVELMPHPARVARDMVEQIRIRCRMWGITVGDMELEEGNMLESKRVDELISKADVLLVDNKVFEESLNEALRPKFLDLKEGAIVVSLKPFVSSLNARVTERNVDDISAIFDVTERPYHSGSVSWGNSGGTYYIHRVDREGYAKIRERFENSRATSSRSSRVRR
ncbi:S-adenosyl-L-methionine-dependent methyltransferase [Crucibulum laeve]|uniref:Histone-lysine N-methyltransferase, H3 lysine-79 specific n=1 Tax=Crucibulum laeve TaxID=68775 RepID=A0A5C3LZH7_9AGAR|nr:S-adenosyl-L-methionine-dependent methyltransferase [Crucibulum laeve]